MMMQGYNLEDVTPGRGRNADSSAAGRRCRDHAVQFSGDDTVLVSALRHRLRQHTGAEAKRARAADHAPRVIELIEKTGLPKGVVNLVNGGREVVDALCDHPTIRAVSFVGSTPVAKHVYQRSAASGKRMQCQGGAKNHVIVLPDADMELAKQIISDSAFGCAGQRCLAVSVAVTIGEAQKTFRDAIAEAASSIKVGYGLDTGVQMGPVITQESKHRIESLIATGISEGAKAIVDGRNRENRQLRKGQFSEADDSGWRSGVKFTGQYGDIRSGAESDPRQLY